MSQKLKTGIILPTCGRPNHLRNAILQIQHQSTTPDLVVVHQNGIGESYEWIIKDLTLDFHVQWIHTPTIVDSAHMWYLPPLITLVNLECDFYFWFDHDDIYFSNHLSEGIEILKTNDICINKFSGLLILNKIPTIYNSVELPHSTGGMASSLCFNRKFAEHLVLEIEKEIKKGDLACPYPDQIVGKLMHQYRIGHPAKPTAMYVAHKETQSSHSWIED